MIELSVTFIIVIWLLVRLGLSFQNATNIVLFTSLFLTAAFVPMPDEEDFKLKQSPIKQIGLTVALCVAAYILVCWLIRDQNFITLTASGGLGIVSGTMIRWFRLRKK